MCVKLEKLLYPINFESDRQYNIDNIKKARLFTSLFSIL